MSGEREKKGEREKQPRAKYELTDLGYGEMPQPGFVMPQGKDDSLDGEYEIPQGKIMPQGKVMPQP